MSMSHMCERGGRREAVLQRVESEQQRLVHVATNQCQ
ncbi:hypothetical protein R3I93_004487 [Phoxinus phoxinus]|uniref:Uncharacterized protein n=1 Tax=Phoxinus phoxinus TaxID=58324 RepID=A0AAN9DGF6_9TELE